jgi:hypothetical protein
MRKSLVIVAATLLGMVLGLVFSVAPAQARAATLGGSGSCSWGSGSAHLYVHELPQEGDLSYVTADTTAQIDVSASTDSPYYNGGNTKLATGYFHSHPIDGDGFWNYEDDWNWDATSTYSTVTKVVFYIKVYGSTAHCTTTVYI